MPDLFIISGPNGAGKSTLAESILLKGSNCKEFVNADIIAKGLSGFNYNFAAFEAGRIMLNRIKYLKQQKENFAFETTLSSKYFVNFIKQCKTDGYKIFLYYIFIKDVEISINRIKKRVKEGGHFIPDEIVKRRFKRSLNNLFDLYIPLSDTVKIYNNSVNDLNLIAQKRYNEEIKIYNTEYFNKMKDFLVKESNEDYGKDHILELCRQALKEEFLRKKKLGYSAIIMLDDELLEISGDELTMTEDEIRENRGMKKKSD